MSQPAGSLAPFFHGARGPHSFGADTDRSGSSTKVAAKIACHFWHFFDDNPWGVSTSSAQNGKMDGDFGKYISAQRSLKSIFHLAIDLESVNNFFQPIHRTNHGFLALLPEEMMKKPSNHPPIQPWLQAGPTCFDFNHILFRLHGINQVTFSLFSCIRLEAKAGQWKMFGLEFGGEQIKLGAKLKRTNGLLVANWSYGFRY